MTALPGLPVEIDVAGTSLPAYTRGLRSHDQSLFALVKRDEPVETWRITGFTTHFIVVLKCTRHEEHEPLVEEHAKKLLAAGLKPFAIAHNDEEAWEVCHYGVFLPEDQALFVWDGDDEAAGDAL